MHWQDILGGNNNTVLVSVQPHHRLYQKVLLFFSSHFFIQTSSFRKHSFYFTKPESIVNDHRISTKFATKNGKLGLIYQELLPLLWPKKSHGPISTCYPVRCFSFSPLLFIVLNSIYIGRIIISS